MINTQNGTLPLISGEPRIETLDVIRGVAILGILLMNIQSFSMIGQAYLNPMAYGDMTGLNKWTWIFSHVFADQKFLSIFSMLFGASVLMISQKSEHRFGTSLGTHYRRNFWLLIIGLIHAYVFWYGDILAPYAVCSFFIYFFRKLPVRTLIPLGILVFSVSTVLHVVEGLEVARLPQSIINQMQSGWAPKASIVQKIVDAYQGSFADQFIQNSRTAIMMQTELFPSFYIWRISGLMLMGMALFRSGFLSGKMSNKYYKKVLLLCGIPGLTLVIFGLILNFQMGWQLQYSMYFGAEFNYWGSLLLALAYLSGIVLLVNNGIAKRVTHRLAFVGRMALTNYLMQTIICTTIFFGFGLGLFGEVERIVQLMIVFAVWGIQLTYSPIWLKKFRFGPMEWLWRSATQMKWQSMTRPSSE